jgi:hypothetical protein
MTKTRVWIAAAGLLLLACGSESKSRPPKPPEFTEAFSNLPLPPNAEFVSRAGGAGALQVTLRSPDSVSQVSEYYRELLSEGGWRLVSDMKNPDGAIALYAEHAGPPLWVRIWPETGRSGTMIQLTGAPLTKDSTGAGHPPTARPVPRGAETTKP